MPRNLNGRLVPSERKMIAIMADLSKELVRKLDSKAYDDAVPTLEPSLEEARIHAGRLHNRLEELRLIVDMEHSERRAYRRQSD